MDININNLRKTETEGEEFKITCNYNLLDNNQFVRWNGNDITLLKPYGLSKVNRIDFRNFKGDLLPYTSLNLPELNFEVLMTSRDIDSASITSTEETIYGDALKYNEDTNTRSVYKFKKAWTYNENEDSQLMYNIREGINIINEHFKTLYPMRKTLQIYGLTNDDINTITYSQNPIDCNAGSMLFVELPNTQYIYSINPLPLDPIHREVFDMEYRKCSQIAINYSNTIGFMWRETTRQAGLYGSGAFIINSGTYDNPTWTVSYEPNIFEDATTTNNKFGVSEFEPSFSLGHTPAGWCVCVSPLISRPGERSLCCVKTTTAAYWLDFTNTANNNIVYVAAVYDDPENNANIYVLAYYTVAGYPDNIITGIFKVPWNSMSTSSSTPVRMSDYLVYNSYPLRSPLFQGNWSRRDRLSTCGKECYGVQIAKDTNANVTGIIFIGVAGCIIEGSEVTRTTDLYAWQVDDTSMFCYNGVDGMKKVSINTDDVMNRINHGYNEAITETMPIAGPVYVCRGLKGWIQNPEALDLRFSPDVTNSFNFNKLKNARYCGDAFGVDMSASCINNGETFSLLHTLEELATTNREDWFSLIDSSIMVPQLEFPGNRVLNFAVRIWTEPYYFEIFTPCQYFGSEVYSIVKPVLMPSYNWLNTHIVNTLETLIILHYEYNNIKITCQMFPNMDGVVFFVNEDAFIGFKSMNVSNTIDGLKVSIIGDNEKVSLETLRRLYGKLSLSVDWVQ